MVYFGRGITILDNLYIVNFWSCYDQRQWFVNDIMVVVVVVGTTTTTRRCRAMFSSHVLVVDDAWARALR